MFDWFRSKKELINKINRLEKKIEELEASEWSHVGFQLMKCSFERTINSQKEDIKDLKQELEDKNQRIAELQQMVFQLQNKEIDWSEFQ